MRYTLGNKSFRNILCAVIVVLGIALSIIVSALSYYDKKKIIQAEFNAAVENRYSALKREIDSDLAVLVSLQALYYTSGKDVERSDFRNFTSHILKQHASIRDLAWIPRVPDSRRYAYERAARREGFPDFQLTERIAQGKMKRAEKRKEYFPVYFLEPNKGHDIALGFDLVSDPKWLEAMEAARKTGEIRANGRITFVTETKKQFDFIIFAPIYRKGVLINSDRARWDNLKGFALGTFRISDIVETATNYLKPEGIDLFISDASAPSKERFLYTHSGRLRKTPLLNQDQPETDVINSKTLEVGGRKWMAIYSATPDYIAARSRKRSWGILLAGLAFTGLVAGFLFIVSRAEHVENLAKHLSDVNTNLAHEIMERKKAEEAVREQRMIFETILEQSIAGYWDWDFRNGTEYLSPSFKKMLGYEDHELPNDPDMWKKLIFPEDLPVVIDTFHRYIKSHGKIPYNYEVRYRHKNGSTVWVYCAGKVIEWNRQGRAARMIGCHLDITEHKKLEEELVKARNLESIGILAGGIAHDFNNLLTGVFGYISLAKQYTPKTSKAYPMLEKVELAYNEASSLTNQFISCSKGGICVEETIQPANLIRAAVSTIMSGSNIKMVFNIPDDLWSIHADTRQLAQAIGNIALNARDAMPSGGMLLVSASNAMLQLQEVAGLEDGRYIKISIRDEGCGIAPDILPKIFDPYFSTKELGPQKGMGLGLTVSEVIIKKHNGVITVESEPGKGSNFTIYLPAC